MAHMQDLESDALVIFGITGDLAYKKIIPAVENLIRRGRLDAPVLGVAREAWTKERLRERLFASLREHGDDIDETAFASLCERLRYVGAITAIQKHFANSETLWAKRARLCTTSRFPRASSARWWRGSAPRAVRAAHGSW